MNTWTEHVHPNVLKHIWLHEKLNSITPAEVAPALTSHIGRRKQTHFSRSINRPSFSGPHVCWRGCGRINQRGESPPPYFRGSLINSLIWVLRGELTPEAAEGRERMHFTYSTPQQEDRQDVDTVWVWIKVYVRVFFGSSSVLCSDGRFQRGFRAVFCTARTANKNMMKPSGQILQDGGILNHKLWKNEEDTDRDPPWRIEMRRRVCRNSRHRGTI